MAPEPEVATPAPDLLGRILSSQSLLMLSSADVLIHRDGSLSAKRPGTHLMYTIPTYIPRMCTPCIRIYIPHLSNTFLYINIHTRVHASHALHCTYTLAPRAHRCLTLPCMQQD